MFDDKPKPEKPENNGNNGDVIQPSGWKSVHKRMEKSMETKYTKDWGSNKISTLKNKITDRKTKYMRLGYTQNPRKVEMTKCGAATTKKRGPINPAK